MTGSTMVALTLAGTALWCVPSSADPLGRLATTGGDDVATSHAGRAPWTAAGPDHVGAGRVSPGGRRALFTASGLFAVGLLLDLWPWWVGVGLSVSAAAATLRMPQRRSVAESTDDRRRLAVHADLLAACLEAGMSIGAALLAVPVERGAPGAAGRWRGGDPDDPFQQLGRVAALLTLGADPGVAWSTASNHPDLADLAAAARRSSSGGATLAQAVRQHAARLRAAIAQEAARSAGRAGVAITAPLGLCFLPAFLCLGLAPVVVGLLGTLHLF
ncbi:hypothetical protein ABIB25_004132 [Nakamurella sp. UYEF19]|uniref:type II secretion system F family protein n=1 Tax=Nakamurella sp. UYEF19 TaxID=1756392 RepID=UPI003391B5A0